MSSDGLILQNAESIWSMSGNKPTDVVEFRPWRQSDLESLFVCGTYELNPNDHNRHGGLHYLRFDSPDCVKSSWTEGEACFDICWSKDGEHLLQASTDGFIRIVKGVETLRVSSTSMATCVDQHKDNVCFATSDGFVGIADWPTLTMKANWRGHDLFEIWACALDRSESLLYSGADDCKFKGWDIRDHTRPVFVCSHHEMGVTSIQSSRHQPNIVATGLYAISYGYNGW
jgi:diphthine methyl ester acylhydrolase